MKTFYATFLSLTILLLSYSCEGCRNTEEGQDENEEETVSGINESPNDTLHLDGVRLSDKLVIVDFQNGQQEQEREELRDKVHAVKKSVCSCGDNPIELWEINTDFIEVEEAVSQAKDNGGKGGVRGDREFTFPIHDRGILESSQDIMDRIGYDDVQLVNILEKITVPLIQSGDRINIAVVDTGYDFLDWDKKANFLYNTKNLDIGGCDDSLYKHISGWNFVSNNGNVADDHRDGHGTFVTNALIRELEDAKVPYSILPVKAFNDHGQGSYWNLVCALNYIKEIQAKRGDIHLINASFGYDFGNNEAMGERLNAIQQHQELSILRSLIDQLNNNTIFVASAGNIGLNNDELGNAHFPSGFSLNNVVGVGGYIKKEGVTEDIQLHIAGNYGSTSIDLAAPYKIEFPNGSETTIKTGTSYGTPIVTARLAQFIKEGMHDGPSQTINAFFASPFVKSQAFFEEKIAGGRYITSNYQYLETIRPTFHHGDGEVTYTKD